MKKSLFILLIPVVLILPLCKKDTKVNKYFFTCTIDNLILDIESGNRLYPNNIYTDGIQVQFRASNCAINFDDCFSLYFDLDDREVGEKSPKRFSLLFNNREKVVKQYIQSYMPNDDYVRLIITESKLGTIWNPGVFAGTFNGIIWNPEATPATSHTISGSFSAPLFK